jgi:AsmA-like C-terminal region
MWHDDFAFKSACLIANSRMDLSAIYSKTPKGLRARASLIGGLPSHLMKVLTHVDGNSKAENILLKFDNLSPQQLSTDLKRLEQEGYIRLATVNASSDDGWALTTNFTPMVVEEYQSEAELEATAKANNEAQARLDAEEKIKAQEVLRLAAEQKAKQEQDRQLAAALKAEKKAQKLRDKEKTKAEVKVKAQLEQERIAEEKTKAAEAARIKGEAEAQLKVQQDAERIAQQQAAERAAKLEEESRQKAELKAREAAEQAQEDAEAAAKENARREIERISREAEEAQNKAEAEVKAKQEAERVETLRLVEANEEARLKTERKAKEEAEAEAQAAAQAKLKVKADAEALQAKIKATAEAELQAIQAREQALALAKAQEFAAEKSLQEQKAEQAAKEKAHSDIANVLRKAEQDRKNAVAQAKAEKLEAKRLAKVEQEARIQAERKAKDDAKELAKQQKLIAQAEQKTQAEAARILKEKELARANEQENMLHKQRIDAELKEKQQAEAEQQARLQIEQQTQQEANTIRDKLAAEEKASIEAKENARLEMERIGREADIARQATITQQHVAEVKKNAANPISKELAKNSLPNLDDFDAAEAAEEAAFQAEEQAQEEQAAKAEKQTKRSINKIEKTAQQASEDAGRADIKNAAIAEAKALASMHASTKSYISTRKIKQWLAPIAKGTLIYLPVLLLILVVLAHFINLSALIKPIEQLASDSIGEPVAIQKVHASLWPQPHLVLQDVTIGANNNIKTIHVLPVASSLFEPVKEVKSLVVEGLTLEQANFGQPLKWASNINAAKNLKVAQINLKNLTLTIRDLQLETFDGKVTLTDTGALSAIDLVSSNNALSVMITPQANDYDIVLKAANWALPFNQKIMFGTLNAKGVASENQLAFSQIEGEIFGGNLTAATNIQWPNGVNKWQTTGNFKLDNASAEQLLNTFGSEVQIDGKLTLNGDFSNQAGAARELAEATIISANFDVRQGGIKGIELARAVLNRNGQSLAGNTTSFDALTGTFNANKGQYQFSKLQLNSPQFRASGFVKVAKNQAVSGRLNADLAAQSRRLQANFGLIGRGKDLKSN